MGITINFQVIKQHKRRGRGGGRRGRLIAAHPLTGLALVWLSAFKRMLIVSGEGLQIVDSGPP